MEEVEDECPTEILVELKEESFVPSHINQNDFQNLLDYQKSDVHSKSEEHLVFERKSEDYESILDMSPFRIKEKFCQIKTSNIDFEAKQELKMNMNIDDCPTGILVDLPNNSNSPFKACTFSYNTPYTQKESKMGNLQNAITGATDSKKEVYLSTGIKNCRISDDTDDGCCSKANEGRKKLFASKSGFKTPSPQSMSLISSEVSKVINNLNSSLAFEEEDLLNEEMLPIPLNFDFDDISDREKQLPKVTDFCENKIGDDKISTSIQTQGSSNKSGENIESDTVFYPGVNENLKVSSQSEDYPSPLSAEASCSPVYSYSTEKTTSDEHSKKDISCEIKSDSLDTSNISASTNSTDDVFIMSYIADEDKENVQGDEVVLPKKNLKSCKTLQKKSFISVKKGSRVTLKNLSNINTKSANKDSALSLSQNSHNKEKAMLQMKMSNNSKMLQAPSSKKLQLKKTVSAMESRIASKRMSLSNSFHFQSSKELIPSLQRPDLVEQNASFHPYPSYKSYIKQENLEKMKSSFATPSKRYSISTPLQGAALKSPFTPLLQGSQNRALPRFTPQSVGSSRHSFSKSLQPSSKNSHFSMKQQCSTSSVSSKLSQPSLVRLNSTKPDKSFGQGIFASNSKILGKSSLSTSNMKRFCSKLSLPSPFAAVQEKHLARVLFPSDP